MNTDLYSSVIARGEFGFEWRQLTYSYSSIQLVLSFKIGESKGLFVSIYKPPFSSSNTTFPLLLLPGLAGCVQAGLPVLIRAVFDTERPVFGGSVLEG